MTSEYQIAEQLSGRYGIFNTDGAPALTARLQTFASGN